MATHALRAALRHFQERLQSQEAQLGRLRNDIDRQAAELARCRTALQQRMEVSRLQDEPARRDAERTGLAGNGLWASRLGGGGLGGSGLGSAAKVGAAPEKQSRRMLRRLARDLRRLLPHAWGGSPSVAPQTTEPFDAQDYRVRMRALRASGQLARVRTVALIAPDRLRHAAHAVAHLIDGMSLRCTVLTAIPTAFTEDLYVVLSPCAFEVLPPPERRILWLVEPGELADGGTTALHTHLDDSLAVFEAMLPRIAELQVRRLAQDQIFHVPLTPRTATKPTLADRSPLGLPHMLARALHGVGVLDDAAFEAATAQTRLDAPATVLCLPEAPERFAHARESQRHGAILFPGLRHLDGWKGTALSYRYLARRALQAQRKRLIVWEDDARLPTDFDVRLSALLALLDTNARQWDLFSGLITDLSPHGRIKAVQTHGDGLLIEIDTVIGMVFGIYGPKALQALADYQLAGEDVGRNTIDRYLETLGLHCCTVFPPLVGHSEHLSSTLWSWTGRRFLSNDLLNPMIDLSQLRLLSKVADTLDCT
ncbi:hypothetical protein [Ancylobacter sp. FA202]|uniref:hypothetical protein n=1 Tax=Ancylobacter sp. FA202 TaxID=1111106 RepID=UPI00037C2463|nr:hypothetical protein [Ancylobacter sp. FA202]